MNDLGLLQNHNKLLKVNVALWVNLSHTFTFGRVMLDRRGSRVPAPGMKCSRCVTKSALTPPRTPTPDLTTILNCFRLWKDMVQWYHVSLQCLRKCICVWQLKGTKEVWRTTVCDIIENRELLGIVVKRHVLIWAEFILEKPEYSYYVWLYFLGHK